MYKIINLLFITIKHQIINTIISLQTQFSNGRRGRFYSITTGAESVEPPGTTKLGSPETNIDRLEMIYTLANAPFLGLEKAHLTGVQVIINTKKTTDKMLRTHSPLLAEFEGLY